MTEKTIQGIGASEGIAIGPAFCYRPVELTIPSRGPASSDEEFSRFEAAKDKAREEINAIYHDIAARTGEEHAAIFEGHMLILDDPMLGSTVRGKVDAGEIVESAVVAATEEIAGMFAAMDDELFAARALDVRDVGRRILRILLGIEDTSFSSIDRPSVVIAYDLTPSDTASLDPELTLAMCTGVGGLTSHTAILARTFGIPAVVGLGGDILDQVATGDEVVLDGIDGNLIIDPKRGTKKTYNKKKDAFAEWVEKIGAYAHQPAETADGMHVEIAANIGDVESAANALEFGAEGVGLLRTEFLYLTDTSEPSEEKQTEAYRAIFKVMGDKPVIVRTMDIGGDKPPSFIDFPEEMNPFLGWRAIRICMDDIPLFKTQLRAILRAGDGYNVLIMFPMISGVEELRFAKSIVEECKAELIKEGFAFNPDTPVGIMVETPGAAMMADALAEEVDFFSIGTNDLTQYTLAVDRGNEKIGHLYQPLHPAVLRLINHTIEAAHSRGKWVGMCGELAGMQKAIPILLGFGLDEFSMVARAIPEAKYLFSHLTTTDAAAIADEVLSMGTTEEIEKYMADILSQVR